MKALQIYVGQQYQGATFQLSPSSRRTLQAQDIGPGVRSLFIANEPQDSFEDAWAAMAPQIVSLLTGVSHSQLPSLGSVEFIHPKDESILMSINFHDDVLESHG